MVVGFDIMTKGKSNCVFIQKEYVITILGIGILQTNVKVITCETNVLISNLNLN